MQKMQVPILQSEPQGQNFAPIKIQLQDSGFNSSHLGRILVHLWCGYLMLLKLHFLKSTFTIYVGFFLSFTELGQFPFLMPKLQGHYGWAENPAATVGRPILQVNG